jgi:Rrf2 family protein
MILSQTCRAAIKALIFIASQHKEGNKTGLKEIAAEIQENEHTIGKTLQIMVKNNLVSSQKGPTGGFFLSESQLNEPIISVVNLLDGNLIFHGCVLGLEHCSALHPCPMHHDFKIVRDKLLKIFSENTIKSLREDLLLGTTFLSHN